MASYRIEFKGSAEQDIRKISRARVPRLLKEIEALRGGKDLQAEDWRLSGDLRGRRGDGDHHGLLHSASQGGLPAPVTEQVRVPIANLVAALRERLGGV